jgi:hypothetical protein
MPITIQPCHKYQGRHSILSAQFDHAFFRKFPLG